MKCRRLCWQKVRTIEVYLNESETECWNQDYSTYSTQKTMNVWNYSVKPEAVKKIARA